MPLSFPSGFVWGTSTAAYQVEGQNFNNDWWQWEQIPGRIRNGDSARVACDWWGGRDAEDFDRAQQLGTNAHRLSIEWSRLEPREGEWDAAAAERYRTMLKALKDRGIEPFVTLLHFTQPIWFMNRGGWLDDSSPALFRSFVTHAVRAFGDLARKWITINEPNLYMVLNYVMKGRPPGDGNILQALGVAGNLIRGHALAYHAIHEAQPSAMVGIAHHWRWMTPANPASSLDRISARLSDYLTNRMFVRAVTDGFLPFPMGRGEALPESKSSFDYFALNYYFEDRIAFDLRQPGTLFAGLTPVSWLDGTEFESFAYAAHWSPASLYHLLKQLSRYGRPIYVTENGVFDIGGDAQSKYLVQHLMSVHRALQDGVDVRGYFWWSLIDNFEWEDGYWLRFGLYQVDFNTQARTARPVSQVYSRIIKEGGIADELVEGYGRAD